MRKRLEFWYEFASTYSYLSAMRIDDLAAHHGVEVVWRPFLLGPIFKAQGWNTSPFNIYPAKGRHMRRDLERITKARGLPFQMPQPFPQMSLYAARLAFAGESEGWTPAFSRAVFRAEFGMGADISSRDVLAGLLESIGLKPAPYFDRIERPAIKDGLKARTEEAQRRGIFGAPSFITEGGELFWGDDRLRQALRWAASENFLENSQNIEK